MTRQTVAIIPARGGSKRLPGKNVRPLHGLPLIAWTMKAARMARSVDRVILSSDDEAACAIAAEYGCEVPFIRPAHLATDEATTADVIIHAIETLDLHTTRIVILQPTSPLRLPDDIDNAIAALEAHDALACVSVTALPKPESFYTRLQPEGTLRSGDVFMPDVAGSPVLINGAVYIVDARTLLETGKIHVPGTVGYLMPYERAADIDTLEDFNLAEALWPLSWGLSHH